MYKFKVFLSIVSILFSLFLLFLTKGFEVEISLTGKFLIGIGLVGILIGLSALFLILYQFISEKSKEKIFARKLLKTYEVDKALDVIEEYRDESFFASVLAHKRINTIDLVEEIMSTKRQRHVRKFMAYLMNKGKSDDALGYLLRHLIAHKKIPRNQSYFLEKELGRYLRKKDVIGKLYERI